MFIELIVIVTCTSLTNANVAEGVVRVVRQRGCLTRVYRHVSETRSTKWWRAASVRQTESSTVTSATPAAFANVK
jgi:hypothetical protein